MLGGAIATSTPTIASSFGPRSSPVTRSSQIAQSNPPRSSQMAQSNLPHSPLDFGKVYGPPTNQRQPSHAAHPSTGGGGMLHPPTSAVAMGAIATANPMLSSMTANATTTTTGNHRKAPMLARKTNGAWPIASSPSSSSTSASTQLPPSMHPTPTLTSMEHMRTLALGSFRPMTMNTAPPPSAPTHQLQTVTTGATMSTAPAPVAGRIWTGQVGSSGPGSGQGPNEHSELSSPSRFPPVATAATKPYVGSHPPSEQPTLADSNNYHNQSNNNNISNGHPQEEAMTMATAVMPQPTTLQVTVTLVTCYLFVCCFLCLFVCLCCFVCLFVCLFNESSIPLTPLPQPTLPHTTDRSMRTSCLPVVLSFAPSSLPIHSLLPYHCSQK